MYSFCVTGQSPNKLYGYDIHSEKYKELERAMKKSIFKIVTGRHEKANEKEFNIYTGMGLGADQLFAEAAFAAREYFEKKENGGIKLNIIATVPYKDQDSKWYPKNKELYKEILEKCDKVEIISEKYTPDCMKQRNEYMIDNSDTIISIWDEANENKDYITKSAEKKGKTIIKIDPKTNAITIHNSKKLFKETSTPNLAEVYKRRNLEIAPQIIEQENTQTIKQDAAQVSGTSNQQESNIQKMQAQILENIEQQKYTLAIIDVKQRLLSKKGDWDLTPIGDSIDPQKAEKFNKLIREIRGLHPENANIPEKEFHKTMYHNVSDQLKKGLKAFDKIAEEIKGTAKDKKTLFPFQNETFEQYAARVTERTAKLLEEEGQNVDYLLASREAFVLPKEYEILRSMDRHNVKEHMANIIKEARNQAYTVELQDTGHERIQKMKELAEEQTKKLEPEEITEMLETAQKEKEVLEKQVKDRAEVRANWEAKLKEKAIERAGGKPKIVSQAEKEEAYKNAAQEIEQKITNYKKELVDDKDKQENYATELVKEKEKLAYYREYPEKYNGDNPVKINTIEKQMENHKAHIEKIKQELLELEKHKEEKIKELVQEKIHQKENAYIKEFSQKVNYFWEKEKEIEIDPISERNVKDRQIKKIRETLPEKIKDKKEKEAKEEAAEQVKKDIDQKKEKIKELKKDLGKLFKEKYLKAKKIERDVADMQLEDMLIRKSVEDNTITDEQIKLKEEEFELKEKELKSVEGKKLEAIFEDLIGSKENNFITNIISTDENDNLHLQNYKEELDKAISKEVKDQIKKENANKEEPITFEEKIAELKEQLQKQENYLLSTEEEYKTRETERITQEKTAQKIESAVNWEIAKIEGTHYETPEQKLEALSLKIEKGPQKFSKESGLKAMNEYMENARIRRPERMFLTTISDVKKVEKDHPQDAYEDPLRLTYTKKQILYDFINSPVVQKYNAGEISYIPPTQMPPEVYSYIVEYEKNDQKQIDIPILDNTHTEIKPKALEYINILSKYSDPKKLPDIEPEETRTHYENRIKKMIDKELAEIVVEKEEQEQKQENKNPKKQSKKKITFEGQRQYYGKRYAEGKIQPKTKADISLIIRSTNDILSNIYTNAKEKDPTILKRTKEEKEGIITQFISKKKEELEYMQRGVYRTDTKQFGTPEQEAYIQATENLLEAMEEVNTLKNKVKYEQIAQELSSRPTPAGEFFADKEELLKEMEDAAEKSPLNIQNNETINDYLKRLEGIIEKETNTKLIEQSAPRPFTDETYSSMQRMIEEVKTYDIAKKDKNYKGPEYLSLGAIILDRQRNKMLSKGQLLNLKKAKEEFVQSIIERKSKPTETLIREENAWPTDLYHSDLYKFTNPIRYSDVGIYDLEDEKLKPKKEDEKKYKEYQREYAINQDKYKFQDQTNKTPDAGSNDAYNNTGTDNNIDARNDQEVKDDKAGQLDTEKYWRDIMTDTIRFPPIQTKFESKGTTLFEQTYAQDSEGAKLLEIIGQYDQFIKGYRDTSAKVENYEAAGIETIQDLRRTIQRYKKAVISPQKKARAEIFDSWIHGMAKDFREKQNKWDQIKQKYRTIGKEIPSLEDCIIVDKIQEEIAKGERTEKDLSSDELETYHKVNEFKKDTGFSTQDYNESLYIVKQLENWKTIREIETWENAINEDIKIMEDKLKKTQSICQNIKSEKIKEAVEEILKEEKTSIKINNPEISNKTIEEVKRIRNELKEMTSSPNPEMIKESQEVIEQLSQLEKETQAKYQKLEDTYLVQYKGVSINPTLYQHYKDWQKEKPDISQIKDKEEQKRIKAEYKARCPIDPKELKIIGEESVTKEMTPQQKIIARINALIPTNGRNINLKEKIEWQMYKLEENIAYTREYAHQKQIYEIAKEIDPQKDIITIAQIAKNRIIEATMPKILRQITEEKIQQKSAESEDISNLRLEAMERLTKFLNKTPAEQIIKQINQKNTGLHELKDPIESYISGLILKQIHTFRKNQSMKIGGAEGRDQVTMLAQAETILEEIKAAGKERQEELTRKYKITKLDSKEEQIAKIINFGKSISAAEYFMDTALNKKEEDREVLTGLGNKYQFKKEDSDITIIKKIEDAIKEKKDEIKAKRENKITISDYKKELDSYERLLQKIKTRNNQTEQYTAFELYQKEKEPSLIEKMEHVTGKSSYQEYARAKKRIKARLRITRSKYMKTKEEADIELETARKNAAKEKYKISKDETTNEKNKATQLAKIEENLKKAQKDHDQKIANVKFPFEQAEQAMETFNLGKEQKREEIHAKQYETMVHALVNYEAEDITKIINAVKINQITEKTNIQKRIDGKEIREQNNLILEKLVNNEQLSNLKIQIDRINESISKQDANSYVESAHMTDERNAKIENYNRALNQIKKFIRSKECKIDPEYLKETGLTIRDAKKKIIEQLETVEKCEKPVYEYIVNFNSQNKQSEEPIHLTAEEAHDLYDVVKENYDKLKQSPNYSDYSMQQYVEDLKYECKSAMLSTKKTQNEKNWNKEYKDCTIDDIMNIEDMKTSNQEISLDKTISESNSNSNDDSEEYTLHDKIADTSNNIEEEIDLKTKVYKKPEIREDLKDGIEQIIRDPENTKMYEVLQVIMAERKTQHEKAIEILEKVLDKDAKELPRNPQTGLLTDEYLKMAKEKEREFMGKIYNTMAEIRKAKILEETEAIKKEEKKYYIENKDKDKANMTEEEKQKIAKVDDYLKENLKKIGYDIDYSDVTKKIAKAQNEIKDSIKQGETDITTAWGKYWENTEEYKKVQNILMSTKKEENKEETKTNKETNESTKDKDNENTKSNGSHKR